MSLDAKCNSAIGQGKINKTGKNIDTGPKSGTHYADFHYPSAAGSKSPIKGGSSPSDQHHSSKTIPYYDVSK